MLAKFRTLTIFYFRRPNSNVGHAIESEIIGSGLDTGPKSKAKELWIRPTIAFGS